MMFAKSLLPVRMFRRLALIVACAISAGAQSPNGWPPPPKFRVVALAERGGGDHQKFVDAAKLYLNKLAADNAFHFVLSPSRPISVMLVQGEGAGAGSSLYLTTALDVGKAPPFKTEVVPVSRVAPASFEQRSVVILNDAGALSTPAAERLAAFVKAGGGLFIILGERNPLGNDTLLLPGALGAPVDRAGLRGGTLGYLDYSHKVFEPFKDPRNGNFTNVHFFKYRALTPTATRTAPPPTATPTKGKPCKGRGCQKQR